MRNLCTISKTSIHSKRVLIMLVINLTDYCKNINVQNTVIRILNKKCKLSIVPPSFVHNRFGFDVKSGSFVATAPSAIAFRESRRKSMNQHCGHTLFGSTDLLCCIRLFPYTSDSDRSVITHTHSFEHLLTMSMVPNCD